MHRDILETFRRIDSSSSIFGYNLKARMLFVIALEKNVVN